MSRLAAAAALALITLSTGAALGATPRTLDPACVNHAVGQLCDLPDSSGGTCVRGQCDGNACLVCVPAPNDQEESSTVWMMMLAFGVTVTGVGGYFWLKLNKLWSATPP